MRIAIQGLGYPLTAALLVHTDQRLRFALARTGNRIKRVVVRMGEATVARGGEDKFCRMHVYFKNAPPVVIEDTGADLYAVIARVAERAGRYVALCVDHLYPNVRIALPIPLRVLPGDNLAMS